MSCNWSFWHGEQLSSPFAFDTETDMPPPGVPPNAYSQQMVVLTATDARSSYVVGPVQLAEFVERHKGHIWVGHNVRFDYWSVRNCLEDRAAKYTIPIWDAIPDTHRFRDTMLMDFLYRLATTKKPDALEIRGLKELARDVGVHISKTQVHDGKDVRTGFGEWLGLPVEQIPTKCLDYAVMDTVATLAVFHALDDKVQCLVDKQLLRELATKYGCLTEALQIKADIAIAKIGKTGIAVDTPKVEVIAARMWEQIQDSIKKLSASYPEMFHYHSPKARAYVPNSIKLNKATQLPPVKQSGVRKYLAQAVEQYGVPEEQIMRTPKDDTKWVLALDHWRGLCPGHPFVDSWSAYEDLLKMHEFVRSLKGKSVMHADYRVLKVTGRTGCTGKGGGVNIQQWPRDAEMRSLFIARPGHTLVISDYSAIELRTFASVLMDMYGESKLAEVLKKGVDPHAYTAAICTDTTLDDFLALQHSNNLTDVARYKSERQAAKAINFGVPGGLGPRRLAGYARLNYGVDMSLERATELRRRLITDIYPEIGLYLRSFEYKNMAINLGCKWEDVIGLFNPDHPAFWYVVQRVVGVTDGVSLSGKPYPEHLTNKVWRNLAMLDSGNNKELTALIRARKGCSMLRRMLFGEVVQTRTGRLRAGADYGEARNTRFQGLAADGAKLALWRLYREGHRVVAFIHDEVVVECDVVRESQTRDEVETILREEMTLVVGLGPYRGQGAGPLSNLNPLPLVVL